MSFNNSWDMPQSRGRRSNQRFQTNRSTRRGRHWQKSRSRPFSSYQNLEHNNYNFQPVQEPEYYSNTYPESSNRRFRSPPSFKSPIYEDRPRPASPLPGSEEYTQRNIQQTSEYIKRQLNLEGQTEDSMGNEFQEPMYIQNKDFMSSQEEESVEDKNVERDSEQNIKKANKIRNRNRSCESIDVREIHDKIIKHISQLSYNKKMNLVHQGLSGYDSAIQQIQKQQRLELSKALRNMSNKTTQDSSDCEVINAIIPDIGIRIEDLPREVIAQLSSTLDIDFDVKMIDPEACFKQAEELLDNQRGLRQSKDLDPFDFEYLNAPVDSEPKRDNELESDDRFDNDSRLEDEKEDEFVFEINPNSSYLREKQSDSVNGGIDGQTRSASVLKIKTDFRNDSNEELPSPKYQKKQNIKLNELVEQPTTSNNNNPVIKDNSQTTNLDLLLSQNLWLNNPDPPEEEMLKSPVNHSSRHPDTKSNCIPPLIPPNQHYDKNRDFSKHYPKFSPPNQQTFDNTKDYSNKPNLEEDFTCFEDSRQFDLQQIEIQQQLRHLKMKQQELDKKRSMFEPSSSKILLQQQFLLKENLELQLSPRQNDLLTNDFRNPEFSLSNDGYQTNNFREANEDGLHKPTIAEKMYLDSSRKFLSRRERKRDHEKNKFSYNRNRKDNRRNRNRRSLSNESYGDKRLRRSEEDFGRRSDRTRNAESWSRSRSKDKMSREREENFNNNTKDRNEDMSTSVGHEEVKVNEESKYRQSGSEKNKRFDQGHEKKKTPVKEIEKKQSIIKENESNSSVDENKEKKGSLEESEENVANTGEKCKQQVIEQFDENGKRKPFRIPKLSQKKNDSTVSNKVDERLKEPPKKLIDEVPKKQLKKTNEPNKQKDIEEKMNKLLDNEINKGKDLKNPDLKASKKDSKKYKRIDRERLKSEEIEDRKFRSRKSDEKNKLDELKKSSETLEKKSKGKDKLSEEVKVCEKKRGKSKRLEEAREKKSVEKEIKASKVEEEIDERENLIENDTEMKDRNRNNEEGCVEDMKEAGEDKLSEEDKSENVEPKTDGGKNEQYKEKVVDEEKPQVEEESNEGLAENSEEMQENAEEDKIEKDDKRIEDNMDVKTKESIVEAEGNVEDVTNVKGKKTLTDEKELSMDEKVVVSTLENDESVSLDTSKFLNSPKIVVMEEEVVSRKTWKSPGERKLLPPLVHTIDSEETIKNLMPKVLNFEEKDEQRNIFEQMEDFNTLMMNQSDKKNANEDVEKVEDDMKGEENSGEEMIDEENEETVKMKDTGTKDSGNMEDGENDVNVKEDQIISEVENKGMDEEKIDVNDGRDDEVFDVSAEKQIGINEGSRENVDMDDIEDKIEETVLVNVKRSKSGINRSRSNARPKSKQKGFLESKIKELNENLTTPNEESTLNKKRKRSVSVSSAKFKRALKDEESENETEASNTPRTRRNSLRSTQNEILKTPSKPVERGVSIEIQTDPVYVVPQIQKENIPKCNKTHCTDVVNRLKDIDKVIADLLQIRQSLYEELRFESEETTPARTRNSSCEATADSLQDSEDFKHQKISKKPNTKRKKPECSAKGIAKDDSITSVIQQLSDPFEIPPKSESPFRHPAHVPQVNIPNELRVRLIRYTIADLERFKDQLNAAKQESLVKLVSAASERQCGGTVSEDVWTDVNIDYKGWVGSILVIKVIDSVVVAGNDKGSLYFYDLVDGDLKAQMHLAQKPITSVCVSRSKEARTTLYVGSLDGTLHVVDFETHESVKSLHVEDPIQCMESAWGYIFIGSHKGNLIRYDIKKEKVEDSISISNTNVLVLRATQEGARKVLLVATRNYPVSVRDAMTGLLMRTMEGTLNPTVYTLLFHNSHVYCGTRQHDVLVYTFQDGQLMFKHEQSNTSGVVCMTIVKNLLFVGCYNGNIYVYNTNTNDFITSIAGPGGLFLSMEVAGNIIVAGTKQNRFRAWTLPDAVLSQIV